MSGMVALAIRKNGRTTVRKVSEWHACAAALCAFALDCHKDADFREEWDEGCNLVLAPKHQGLAIIDFDTKWCISCSGYGGMGEAQFQLTPTHQVDDLVQLLNQGLVKSLFQVNLDGPDIALEFPKVGANIHDIHLAVIKAGRAVKDSNLLAQLLPPEGWEFEALNPKDTPAWARLMTQLDAKGFGTPDQGTLRAWDEFFEDNSFQTNPTDDWRARLQAQTRAGELDAATRRATQESRRRGL